MADEPTNPQKVIDDAAKSLGSEPVAPILPPSESQPLIENPASVSSIEEKASIKTPIIEKPSEDTQPVINMTPPPPVPQTESLVVPPTETVTIPPQNEKPEKKKSGNKGILLGIIIFFVLTLPVAIYYSSQQYRQVTNITSKATGVCTPKEGSGLSGQNTCTAGVSKTACCLNSRVCDWSEGCASATTTPTPTTRTTGRTIVERGCIGGTFINTAGGCTICSFGGSMTCAGPSGGSGGDPCQVKYSDGTVESVACLDANMWRCNCGGNAWVGGRPTTSCAQLCACAGINCDTCTPTPGPTTPNNPTNTPVVTQTPTPTVTGVVTSTPSPSPTGIQNTPQPGRCDASCDTDSNCESGLSCLTVTGVKRCRKIECPDKSDCSCPTVPQPGRCDASCDTDSNCISGLSCLTSEGIKRCRNYACPDNFDCQCPVIVTTKAPVQTTPKVPVAGLFDGKAVIVTIGSVLLLLVGLAL